MALRLVDEATGEMAESAEFADFWALYPRHIAKLDASKAWAKLTPDQQMCAVVGAADWRAVWLRRGELEFVPYPATWLRGQRWEDEPPNDALPTHASHVICAAGPTYAKTAMPEHVRALLAKLRRK